MNTHLEITLNYFNLPIKQIDLTKVKNVYVYGSYVYGTNTETSDIDYIIVYDQDTDISDTIIATMGDTTLNATLISPSYFQKMIDKHSIDSLECMFLRSDWTYKTLDFTFNLDLGTLRRSISAVCSNSWVKCKKKFTDGEDYIGKKSLFHSLRIADFGIQISKHGKIIDYTKPCSDTLKYDTFDSLLTEIKSFNTWKDLKDKYQNIANNLRSEFRLSAPLEIK